MKRILLSCVVLLIISCSSESQEYILIQNTTTRTPFISHSFPYFIGYFYEGSDKNYHYFVEKWKFQEDNYFKLSTDALFLNEVHMYGDKQIKVNAFQTEKGEEFGKTSSYKIYYEKL